MNSFDPVNKPRTNRLAALLVTVLAVLVLLLSACGSDDSAVSTAEASSATSVSDTSDDLVEQADDDHDSDHEHRSDADHDHEDDSDDDPDDDPDEAENAVVAASASPDYLGSYDLVDEAFGTMVTVTVADGTRTILSNSLPDHETGEFPNSGNPNTISEQSIVLEYSAEPVYTGDAQFAQQPGIAVNGVAFEPGTAETVSCASGETYRIEGLQDLYDLGMDFNNAHVQPTGQYHYHGIAELLVGTHDTGDDDVVLVGFAADGHLMYYSKSGAYASSYELSSELRTGSDCTASGAAGGSAVVIDGTTPDGTYNTDWVYVEGGGDLDSCNGTIIDGEYAYVLTDEYPFVPRCLNGEFTATGPGAGGGGAGQAPGQNGGGVPDFGEAAAALGVTEEELLAALGDPPPDLAAAAETLGITVEDLEAVLPAPPGQ